MSATDITIRNAWICKVTDGRVIPFFGDLHIVEGRIEAVCACGTRSPAKNVLDAAGRVITIPMVNFHEHCYSRLSKGLNISGVTDNFIHILENLWWKLDRALDQDMIRASAELTAIESIANGVTYVFDHHASPACISGSLTVIADAFRSFGLRGVLCYETSDRNGKEDTQKAIEENHNYIKHSDRNDFKGMFGLHAPFTLSEETLKQVSQIREELQASIHIHISEDRYDLDHNLRTHGIVPALRLQNHQLLTDSSILAHGVHLSRLEYRIIEQYGSAIACCPDSNLNNGVSIPDYASIPKAIPVLSGTDGMHANIARTMSQLFLLYRHQGSGFAEAFSWIKKIYFDQIHFVRQYFPDYPNLTEGDRADMIIWDYIPPTPFDENNFFGHYVYGMLDSRIHSTIHSGSFLLKEFEPTVANQKDLSANIMKQGIRLHERFAELEKMGNA